MRSPFPGMDPYLEQKELWPDVHDRLIVAIADEIAPRVAPRYVTRLQRRTYLLHQDELDLVGLPDVAVLARERVDPHRAPAGPGPAGLGVLDVEVPLLDEVSEGYLEIRTGKGVLITTVEILSPVNKVHTRGRRDYETKRNQIFASMTNLVEIDLLRAGKPMPLLGPEVASDYRILVSRGFHRPSAQLHVFGLRDPIPTIAIPLRPEDEEPLLDPNAILHQVYQRARYDLEIDYAEPISPPFDEQDAVWARTLGA